jgi:hypothetical protein
MVETAKENGVTIGAHPAGVTAALQGLAIRIDMPTVAKRRTSVKTATKQYLAVAFIIGADKLRYGTLVEAYPTTVAEAYGYLCNYKKDPKNLTRLLGHNGGRDNLSTGVAFAQDGNNEHNTPSTRGQAFAINGGAASNANRTKVCRRCGTDGHTSIECDSGKDKVEVFRQSQQANQGVSQLIHAVNWDGTADTIHDDEATNWVFLTKTFTSKGNSVRFTSDGPSICTEHDKNGTITQTHESSVFSQANSGIPKIWYLLDNQSTCDIVSNPKLVKNI